MKRMSQWTADETITHIWNGLGYYFTFTHIEPEPEFIDRMIAKYILSSIFLCFGLTVLRLQKKSQRIADSKEAFFFYLVSCLSQIFMRTLDSSLLFRFLFSKVGPFLAFLFKRLGRSRPFNKQIAPFPATFLSFCFSIMFTVY